MKIKTEAIIKNVKITPECGKLDFEGCDFTSQQYKDLSVIVKEKEKVYITIEPIQETMFGDDKVDAADGLHAPSSKKKKKP